MLEAKNLAAIEAAKKEIILKAMNLLGQ